MKDELRIVDKDLIAKNIRTIAKKRGISLFSLSLEINCRTSGYIWKIMDGMGSGILDKYAVLADELGVTLDDLIRKDFSDGETHD